PPLCRISLALSKSDCSRPLRSEVALCKRLLTTPFTAFQLCSKGFIRSLFSRGFQERASASADRRNCNSSASSRERITVPSALLRTLVVIGLATGVGYAESIAGCRCVAIVSCLLSIARGLQFKHLRVSAGTLYQLPVPSLFGDTSV